jgi:hypothetical protein
MVLPSHRKDSTTQKEKSKEEVAVKCRNERLVSVGNRLSMAISLIIFLVENQNKADICEDRKETSLIVRSLAVTRLAFMENLVNYVRTMTMIPSRSGSTAGDAVGKTIGMVMWAQLV